MRKIPELYALAITAFLFASPGHTMQKTEAPATEPTTLSSFAGTDHFAAEPGGLYSGVKDPNVREALNGAVSAAAAALSQARASGASDQQVLTVFQQSLRAIDRDTLDTVDAERVAMVFEKLLEGAGLESSGGALNEWMYGFDPG